MPPKSSASFKLSSGRSLPTTARKSVAAVRPKRCTSSSIPNKTSPSPSSFFASSTTTTSAAAAPSTPPPSSLKTSQNDTALLLSSPPDNERTKNSSLGESFPKKKALIPVSQEKAIISTTNGEIGIRANNLILSEGEEVKSSAGDETLAGGGKKKVVKRVKVVKKVIKRVIKKVRKGTLESIVRNQNEGPQKLEAELGMEIAKVGPSTNFSVENVNFELENEGSKEIKVDTTDFGSISPFLEPLSPVGIPSGGPFVDNNDGKEGEEIESRNEDYKDDNDSVEDKNLVPKEEGRTEVEEVVKEVIENNSAGLSGEMEERKVEEVLFIENCDGKEPEGIGNQIEDDNTVSYSVEGQNEVPMEEGATEVGEVVKELVGNNSAELSGGLAFSGEIGERKVEEVPSIDNNDGKESEGIENQNEDDKDDTDPVEDQNAVPMEEGATEVDEVAKEHIENNGAGLCGGVALSGEMEALERRKRRRTEIFVGGLDHDAKEEDIRKVFEQVGEVTEVRLKMNVKTGKNKGFAFVRFASADDCKKALARCPKVEICGKQCSVQPVEGNDTLFLGNINKKWKNDDVIRLLKDAGIEKIDKVTLKADPNNLEQNRGFTFLEFETNKDAQTALNKLQKNDVFNKQMKIKVAWAEPLVEPNEKDMLKVKSVYAEYLPTSWDEEKVKRFFKQYGEIESVTLAKNLPSSRRKDFAFVNYTSREAALACIEEFHHEQVDEYGSKINVKVALANPQKRPKQIKHVSVSTGKELPKNKPKTPQAILKSHEPRKKGIPTGRSNEFISHGTNSTTDELLHLLRQQASGRPMQAGSSDQNFHHSSSGIKRPFHEMGNYTLSDPRGFPRARVETAQLTGNQSSFPDHIGPVPLPYSQQRNSGYTSGSLNGIPDYPHFQTREQPHFFGHGRIYRR